MSSVSEQAVQAASADENVHWEDYDSLDVKGTAVAMLTAAYPVIEQEIVAEVVKGGYPVARETIRADVVREVVEALREGAEARMAANNRTAWTIAAGIREEADRIEREFGDAESPCEDCGGTGEKILNPDWPSGEDPYSEKCSTCGGGDV